MNHDQQLAAAKQLQKFIVTLRACQYAALEFRTIIAKLGIKKAFTEKAHYAEFACRDTLRFFSKFVPTNECERILKDQTNANAALADVLIDISRKVHEDHIEAFEKEVEAIALKYAYKEYQQEITEIP